MAVQGPIPVEFLQVFPRGLYAAGAFEPVRDFDASKAGGRFVQSKDKQSGRCGRSMPSTPTRRRGTRRCG